MMKKKFVFLCLILLLSLITLFANSQSYYAVSSLEWRSVNALCHYAGVVGPTSNGPVTRGQLELALDRVEDAIGKNDPFLLAVYELLKEQEPTVTDSVGSITLSGDVNLEGYLELGDLSLPEKATDGSYLDYDSAWFIANAKERKPLFDVGASFTFLDNAYAVFDYNFSRDMISPDDIWGNRFSSNISLVHTESYPYNAGLSLGNSYLNFMAARGSVSLCEGYTGNTAIGDNYDYQEFARFSLFSPFLSVSLRLTSFDSSHSSDMNNNPYALISPRFSDYKQLRHEVGFEAMFFKNFRLTFSLLNLLDTTSSFDIRFLNPFIVLHNMFNYTDHTIFEANNMLTGDISWAVGRKWNVYFQLTMDQTQSKGEQEAYGEVLDPNAFGYLFNVSYSDYISDGILNIYSEFVYNDPGMYLNSKFYEKEGNNTITTENNGLYSWSQDWLLGYWRSGKGNDVHYAGYKYGPDCIVFSIGGEYRKTLFSLKSSILYMAHGEKGRGNKLSNYTFEGINSKATFNSKAPYGTVEHTLLLSLESNVNINEYVSLSIGGAWSNMFNYLNEKGRNKNSLQLVFGITVKGSIPTILSKE